MGIDKIREYPAQISSTFRRFPAAIAFFFLFAIFNLFHTWSSHHNWVNILDLFFKERVLTFSETYPLWAAFLCIALKLFQESGFKLSRKVLVGCHLLVLAAAATLPLVIPIIETGEYKYLPENVAHFMIAISAILVASTLLLPTLFSRKDFPLWRFAGNFIKSFLLSILVTGAFYLTICLLTFCLCRLFDVNLFMKYGWIYFTEICWFILMPILFLTNLPCVNHSEDVPCLGKFATNILHYLFIPALLIYTAILYIYCLSSIISGKMHCDTFSMTIATVASLSALFYCILSPAKEFPHKKVDHFFLKVLSHATLPLLLAMSVALFHRISTAGLNALRFYIIAINLWLYTVSAIFLVHKIQRKLWWTIASFCIFAFCTSLVPIGVLERSYMRHETYKGETLQTEETGIDPIKRGSYKARQMTISLPEGAREIQYFEQLSIEKENIDFHDDTLFIHVDFGNERTGMFFIPERAISRETPEEDKPPLVLETEKYALIIHHCIWALDPSGSQDNRVSLYEAILLAKFPPPQIIPTIY